MKASSVHGRHTQANAEMRQAASGNNGPLATAEVERFIDVLVVTSPISHNTESTATGIKETFTYYIPATPKEGGEPASVFYPMTRIKEKGNPQAWDRLTDMFQKEPNAKHMVEALQESQVRIVASVRAANSVVSIVHYRLPSTVRNLPTAGVVLNAILSLTKEPSLALKSRLLVSGLSFLGCIGDQSQETVNTIAQKIKLNLESKVANLEPLNMPNADLQIGPILIDADCDVYGQANIEEMLFVELNGSLHRAATKQIKQEETPVTLTPESEAPKGSAFFGYEADSLTLEQKKEALDSIGYDTTELTDSVVSAAFAAEQEALEDEEEEAGEFDLEIDEEPEDLTEEDLEALDEDEDMDFNADNEEDGLEGLDQGMTAEEEEELMLREEIEIEYQAAIIKAKDEGVNSDNAAELAVALGLMDEGDDRTNIVTTIIAVQAHLEEYEEALYAQAVEILKEGNFEPEQSLELAERLGLIDPEEAEPTLEEIITRLSEFKEELEDEEDDLIEESATDEDDEDEDGDFGVDDDEVEFDEEDEEADDDSALPEGPSKYLQPAGSNVLGDMYKLDVNQVLVINFTFTNADGYGGLDLSELTDVDGVNYMFPFQVGQKRSSGGSMMLPAVRTIDLMDSMNPGQVLVSDAHAFDPDEFAERLENLISRGLTEALYEDRVPAGIEPEDYDLPIGEFGDDEEDDAEIAFIEGYDEDLADFGDLVEASPAMPITQLYSGFASVRKMEIDGHCAFTNGVVLNFAVPGIWLESLPEEKIQEMVQGAINATRTRVAGNASCPTYCAFTYDSALIQSNDRVFELVAGLRTLDEQGMSFNAEDVRMVEESEDAFTAIASMEDRELPLTVLMSGVAGHMYDHGGNTTVIFSLTDEEDEEAEDEE